MTEESDDGELSVGDENNFYNASNGQKRQPLVTNHDRHRHVSSLG